MEHQELEQQQLQQQQLQQQHPQQQIQSAEGFGESEYGKRLDYSSPVYRDWWAMVLFYIHLIAVVVITTLFWISIHRLMDDVGVHVDAQAIIDGLSAFWVTIAAVSIAATIIALLWIQIMKVYPDVIIKLFLFLNIAACLAFIILAVIDGITGLVVIFTIILLIICLVTYCAWSRIPFASVCLWTATRIVQTYEGTIYVAILCSFLTVAWQVLWVFMVIGYFILAIENDTSLNHMLGVYFLMLLSYYWSNQVCKAITHTTTCGVAATWVFSPGKLVKPSVGAFKRTMTTSFGSICLGSSITAILSATRAFCRTCRRSPCFCCVYCILLCIERLIKWFNFYAFAQVAIYGTSFMESGLRTFQLLSKVGIWALANDWVLNIAVVYASRITGVICGFLSYLIIFLWRDDKDLAIGFAILMAFFGLFCCTNVLFVIQSCVICIFVCFSEDPMALQNNRPEEFQKLTQTNAYMRNLANGEYQANLQSAEQEYEGGRKTQPKQTTNQKKASLILM